MPRILSLLAVFVVSAASAQDIASDTTEPDIFARDSYRLDALVCPFKGSIDYEPGEIECGLLQVPENREDPDSRFIDLHYIKLHSTWDDEEEADNDEESDLAPGRRDDPVIYLTGGPGAPASYYVGRFIDHGIRRHRDLYILEQRGIANSGNYCQFYSTTNVGLKNVRTLAESNAANRGDAEACARRASAAGVDLTAYNTIENARDVKALRVALGYEQWNVWGISYGSILGQAYIKEDPEGILAVVLDAIVPLDTRADPIAWRTLNWYDRDLRKLDELCQADPNCADNFPGLGDRVRDGARAAIDNPIEVDVDNPEIYPTGKAWIQSDIAAFLPFTLFYEQSNYPALPAIIHAWADAFESRDETFFRALALAFADDAGGFGISEGMYDAILCNDGMREIAVESYAIDREQFPVLAASIEAEGDAEAWVELCETVGMSSRPREQYAAVQTDIPTLLVEGDMDPITPPPLAHAIAPGFENGTYVEFPYAGHGPTRSVECGGDFLNSFFDNPTAEPDVSCAEEMEAPEFIGPLYRTAFLSKLAVLALDDEDSLPGVALWGGASVLFVVLGFIVLTFAPLVRRLEKRKPVHAGGARLATWGAAVSGALALSILGAAAAVSYGLSELLLLFGFVGWGVYGAWFGVLAGLFGIVALGLTIRARMTDGLPIGTLTGFLITAISAVSLSIFLIVWGLGP